MQGLKDDLDVKMVEVGEKQASTNALIEKVSAASEIAEKEMADANIEEEITAGLTEQANKLKASADEELGAALPAMEKAKEAVNCLTKNSIVEMKSLPKPPPDVELVAKAVLIMRGERKNHAWTNGAKMMNNPARFIDEIKAYDANNIDEWILTDLKPIIDNPNFNEVSMRGKSIAASFLCAWVVNIIIYNGIYKKVKPLMDTLAEATAEVETKTIELQAVRARVKEANDKVAAMQVELSEATAIKEAVEEQAN